MSNMIDFTIVDLSRLQFAATAMYHFLFVPLTLGLSFLIAIMESVYVMTDREMWRREAERALAEARQRVAAEACGGAYGGQQGGFQGWFG